MGFLSRLFSGSNQATEPVTLEQLADIVNDTAVEVVGESHYRASFKELLTNVELQGRGTEKYLAGQLTCEPKNKHDKNALQVKAAGLVVGYIAADNAKRLAPRISRAGGSVNVQVRVWAKYDVAGAVFGSATVYLIN